MRTFAQRQNQLQKPVSSTLRTQLVQRTLPSHVQASEARSITAPTPLLGHDFQRIPLYSSAAGTLQTKLAINEPGDEYEQEADLIAEQVTRAPEPQLQRHSAHPSQITQAPPIVHEVLNSPGQPLNPATRRLMESRLGHDFSRVRIHTDSRADESARAVNARAYTVGHNIAFASGRFSPQSAEGQRLLVHELAHVVQQTTPSAAPVQLQREPDKKPKRQNVVLLGEDVTNGQELSNLLAPGGHIIKVKNVTAAAEALAGINFPIGTLYIVAHSSPDGDLQFGKEEGVIAAADIAGKFKDKVPAANAPEVVDFRGCSVGTSPVAMNNIRTALGANSVVAGDCFSIIDIARPTITINKKVITTKADIKPENHDYFLKLLGEVADGFGPKKSCILNRSEDAFFANGGVFVVYWFNRSHTAEWIPGESVCYNKLSPETVDPKKAVSENPPHCRLIKVETKSEEKK
jgi:hypothetical protein